MTPSLASFSKQLVGSVSKFIDDLVSIEPSNSPRSSEETISLRQQPVHQAKTALMAFASLQNEFEQQQCMLVDERASVQTKQLLMSLESLALAYQHSNAISAAEFKKFQQHMQGALSPISTWMDHQHEHLVTLNAQHALNDLKRSGLPVGTGNDLLNRGAPSPELGLNPSVDAVTPFTFNEAEHIALRSETLLSLTELIQAMILMPMQKTLIHTLQHNALREDPAQSTRETDRLTLDNMNHSTPASYEAGLNVLQTFSELTRQSADRAVQATPASIKVKASTMPP